MKVLFVFGGLPHYYNYVLSRLNSIKNIEILVIAPLAKGATMGSGVYQTTEGINFKAYQLPEYTTLYGKSFFRNFIPVLRKERPDIIVTGWPYILAFLFNWRLLFSYKYLGIKLICKDIPFRIPKYQDTVKYYEENSTLDENLHVQTNNKFINFLKYKLLAYVRKGYYNLSDAHVDYVEDAVDIIGSYGVKKEKIFVTYNSPDTDMLFNAKKEIAGLPHVLPENPFRIIHIGRLVKWKKVDLLMSAVHRLTAKYPSIELVVIGDGPQEKELKTLANGLSLSENVKFIGGVYDPATLGRYLNASSVYVLAGMGGLSINEAMCFNKPVICSECDGTEKKLVREGYNGLYFKNGDVADLAEKMDYLLSNPSLVKTYGQHSMEIIQNEINIKTVITGYVNAFNYVMSKKWARSIVQPE